MEMSNTQIVPASQERTWQALNDPEVLKACIPGAQSIEKVSDTEYQVAMVAKVGPVSAKFKGRMRLADVNPPNSYTLGFEGQGGVAGFAKGNAKVSLSPVEAGTQLAYTVDAQVGGKLAQVGSRLINGAAKKIADDFFAAFVNTVGDGTSGKTGETPAVPETPETGGNGKTKGGGSFWRRLRS